MGEADEAYLQHRSIIYLSYFSSELLFWAIFDFIEHVPVSAHSLGVLWILMVILTE